MSNPLFKLDFHMAHILISIQHQKSAYIIPIYHYLYVLYNPYYIPPNGSNFNEIIIFT